MDSFEAPMILESGVAWWFSTRKSTFLSFSKRLKKWTDGSEKTDDLYDRLYRYHNYIRYIVAICMKQIYEKI